MSYRRSLRRSWLRLLAAGPIVLLLAVAPAFLYVDHWGSFAGYAVGHEHAVGDAGAPDHVHPPDTTHRSHCHFGPAGCADQPAPAASHVLPRIVELPTPALSTVAVDDVMMSLQAIVIAPATEPPRL